MVCSQRTTQGSSVYFTNSRDCCSILEKLDFSRSPTIWGGTRKIRAISLTWNFRVSKNCACSGEMPMGVYFMPSSSTAILLLLPLPPKVDCQLSRTRWGSLMVPGCSSTPPGAAPLAKNLAHTPHRQSPCRWRSWPWQWDCIPPAHQSPGRGCAVHPRAAG